MSSSALYDDLIPKPGLRLNDLTEAAASQIDQLHILETDGHPADVQDVPRHLHEEADRGSANNVAADTLCNELPRIEPPHLLAPEPHDQIVEAVSPGTSPLLDASRLAGLLSEAETLLRQTAITAAIASAVANEVEPSTDGVAEPDSIGRVQHAAQGDLPFDASALPTLTDSVPGNLAAADALLDAVDGFLGHSLRETIETSRGGADHGVYAIGTESDGSRGGYQAAVASSAKEGEAVPSASAPASSRSTTSQWVTDARQWDGRDLGTQLEEICRELDEVVGLSTARGRELDEVEPGECSRHLWPLPTPL